MTSGLSVCHVVNSVRDTSTPGDLATTQAEHEIIDEVGILAWFSIEPFRNDEMIDLYGLDVPEDALHLTRRQYQEAKRVLSKFDIVHTHHPHSGFYGKIIAKRLGRPIVVTDHNNHDGFSRKGRLADGLTNTFADRIVPVSKSVEDSYAWWEKLLIEAETVEVINNGVDVGRLESAKTFDWSVYDVADIDSNALLVGSAGMLTEQKAHEVLIDAVDYANERSNEPIELVISGAGERREELQARIEQSDYSNRLHLLGFLEEREQVHKMMHEIDIYAMPSRWEGFCVAALEAMAIGNACVFSDIPEFRRPFADVARFHALDDPDDLSEVLIDLASTQKVRQQLIKSSKELVLEKYTIEQTASKYIKCYIEILNEHIPLPIENT